MSLFMNICLLLSIGFFIGFWVGRWRALNKIVGSLQLKHLYALEDIVKQQIERKQKERFG